MVNRGFKPLKQPQFARLMADKSEEEQIRLRASLPREQSSDCVIS